MKAIDIFYMSPPAKVFARAFHMCPKHFEFSIHPPHSLSKYTKRKILDSLIFIVSFCIKLYCVVNLFVIRLYINLSLLTSGIKSHWLRKWLEERDFRRYIWRQLGCIKIYLYTDIPLPAISCCHLSDTVKLKSL